jgi:hypothetical protein
LYTGTNILEEQGMKEGWLHWGQKCWYSHTSQHVILQTVLVCNMSLWTSNLSSGDNASEVSDIVLLVYWIRYFRKQFMRVLWDFIFMYTMISSIFILI